MHSHPRRNDNRPPTRRQPHDDEALFSVSVISSAQSSPSTQHFNHSRHYRGGAGMAGTSGNAGRCDLCRVLSVMSVSQILAPSTNNCMMKFLPIPQSWEAPISQWETRLKAFGKSPETLRTRRVIIRMFARERALARIVACRFPYDVDARARVLSTLRIQIFTERASSRAMNSSTLPRCLTLIWPKIL